MDQIPKTILLREKDTKPTDTVLIDALGSVLFEVYQQLLQTAAETYQLEATWRFYNDGKAWLCKIAHRKKNYLLVICLPPDVSAEFFLHGYNRRL